MTETQKHLEAFELLYSLGKGARGDKVIDAVAEEYGVASRTIWDWYSKFGWRKRLEERNAHLKADLSKQATKKWREAGKRFLDITVDSRQDFLRLIAECLQEFQKNLADGNVDISSVTDFERLAKLHLTMKGQPTGDETNITIITAVPRPQVIETVIREFDAPSQQVHVSTGVESLSSEREEISVLTPTNQDDGEHGNDSGNKYD